MSGRAWWLSATALLLILAFAALGIAVAIVNPNDYKPQIVAAVQRATGRTLRLGGPLRISRSLWPTIEVTDVTLANLPGGTRPDLVRAERIEAQLSLPALLHRRIEVSNLTLEGPNILFEFVGGKPNWILEPAADTQTSLSGLQLSFDIRRAQVRNGMVTVRLPSRTHVVGIRSLDLWHSAPDGPLDLTTVLVYSDYKPFSLRASAQPTGGVTDPWDTRLDFAAYNATLSAEGRMNISADYDLQVEGQIPELEKLNALLPPLHLPSLHRMNISTHLTSGRVPGDLPVIGETRLQIGSADLGDRLPGLTLGAVEVSLPRAGAAARTSGAGRYTDKAFTFAGTFALPERLDGRFSTLIDLNAQMAAGGTKGSAEGSLTLKGRLALDVGSFDGLDATVGLRLPALGVLQSVLSQALPALTEVSLGGRLSIPADYGSARLRGATLSAHEFQAAGDVTVALTSAMAIDGLLRATRLDLDALLATSGANWVAPDARSADAGGPVIPNTPLPWAILRGKTVQLTASIAALTLGRQIWRDVDLALQLADGRLQVSRLRVALPGGPLEMLLSADATRQDVPVSLTLHAPGIPLALLVRSAALPGDAGGDLHIETQLKAKGRSIHDLAASLDGSFAATMTHGSLSNAALIELASASLQALGIEVPAQGETAIRCFGIVGSFNAGVGRFRTIALDTSYLQLDGAGQVDLGAETLALKLHPLARISGSSVSVPIVVEGPLHAPNGRLDASGLDQLGLLIDGWFGGDQPQTCSDAGLAPPAAGVR
ncbi:MAG TPA: AsmA family protein [Stellaceae bacterium]|nr:AsmA family protein [Stellaceae bacterium]